jgi:hypothetical protein
MSKHKNQSQYARKRQPKKLKTTDNDSRLRLEPSFRDYYNELVRPNVELRVPAYIWKWKTYLSKGSFVVYLRLRSMCYYDLKNADNSRDWCWPKQRTLAEELGISLRSMIDYLKELERYQFILRESNYDYDPAMGKKRRVEDTYIVPWEIPLLPDDLTKYSSHYAEKLIDETLETPSVSEDRPTRKNRTQAEPEKPSTYMQNLHIDPQTEGPTRKNRTPFSGAETAQLESVLRTNTNNVERKVKTSKVNVPGLSKEPEALAYYMSDKIKNLEGDMSSGEHQNHRYFRLLADRVPENLINRALDATRDLKDEGKIRKAPRYAFYGIIKKLAEAEGIEFPTKKSSNPDS